MTHAQAKQRQAEQTLRVSRERNSGVLSKPVEVFDVEVFDVEVFDHLFVTQEQRRRSSLGVISELGG